ncbi:MAG TPA: extracellular solute-binding protein, partial [Acidimicrobiales bacterium]|nr:extracellular solute-binding protein [Acidimicrobiales bacterium]
GLVVATSLAACSNDGGNSLVVYAGRNENLIRPLLERFAKDTGVDITVRYGETAELLPTILEEGKNTRADVFIAQDAGALGRLSHAGFLVRLPQGQLDVVEPRFREPKGTWLALTARVRVIAYNTARVPEDELPQSVFELTQPKWKDRIGFPPTNASFTAFVSALTEEVGVPKVRTWLEGLKANGAKTFDNNVQVVKAISAGEVDLGLVNHYYLYSELKEDDRANVANHYPGQNADGEGTFINISGIGIMQRSEQKEAAERLVSFLLSEESQRFFRDETAEYPVRKGVGARSELPALSSLKTINVPLSNLGGDLAKTQALLKEVGLT